MSSDRVPAFGRMRSVNSFARVVLCDNPGPMELDGTNSWVLRSPGDTAAVVVDPGPRGHPGHLLTVRAALGQAEPSLVLVTHHHHDHTGALDEIVALTGAPVRALAPEHCRGAEPLREGEVITAGTLRLTVLATPGHTDDSVCLLVEDGRHRALVSGDTILGTGTPVLDGTAGALRDYLASLDRLAGLGSVRLLPGHGPDRPDALPVVRGYRRHRLMRLHQIGDWLERHGTAPEAAEPAAVARGVYVGVPAGLMGAAVVSVRAQLAYLAEQGRWPR